MRRSQKLLLPFQAAGVRFLGERRFAILADDPRMGKTRQILVALSEVDVAGALVVVPSLLLRNAWEAEIALTPGVRVDRTRSGILPARGTVRVVAAAELLRRKLSPRAAPAPRSVLIVDEPGLFTLGLGPGTRLRTKLSRLADAFARADGAIWILAVPDAVPYERFCELLETVGFMLRRRAVSVVPRKKTTRPRKKT